MPGPNARPLGASSLVALCALLATMSLAGCGDKDAKRDADADAGATLEIEAEESDPDAPRVYTAEDVSPKVGVYAPPGRAPQRVVFDSRVDLVDSRRDAIDPDADVFSIEPAVAGRLVRASDSRLEFVPRESFTPGQKYTATFGSVGVKKQKIESSGKAWAVSFQAPAFKLIEMGSPIKISPTQVEVELVFSAKPQFALLDSHAQWRYGGESIATARYERATSPEIVRATLTSKAFEDDGKNLALTVAEGLKWGEGVFAPSFTSSARVEEAPELEISSAFHAEGGSGYYIDVICDDDAAAGGKRYYWDQQNYDSYYISSRCLPTDASSGRSIQIEPAVDFTVSPSGAGFRIFGDFKRGDYSLRFASGLRTEDGGVLRRSYEKRLVIPARAPSLNLSGSARYMPRDGFEQVALKHLNVDEVEVVARRIPRANLMFWLSGDDERASSRVSDVVARRKITPRAEEDVEATEWLELSSLLPTNEKGGVYEISVAANGERDAMRLLRTDLNLVVKREDKAPKDAWSRKLHVWAFGMKDLAPRGGVAIELVRPSGSVMATCQTDSKGGCVLDVPPKKLDDTPPLAVLASTNDDFTYLKFDDVKTSINGYSGGQSFLSEEAYDATVYADRDLYRPGETAHFVGVLRERDFAAPEKALPVELVVHDARGRVAKRRVVKTNPAGVVSLDLTLPGFATTGRWSLALMVGERELTRYAFGVEEFVPERMEVRVDTLAEAYLSSEDVMVDVQARYLFGGSAKGSNAELRCRVEPSSFAPESKSDYAFGLVSDLGAQGAVDLGITDTSVLTDDGPNALKCPLMKQAGSFRGHGDVVASVSVTEAGSGRVTTRTTRAPVHPARHAIGMKTDANEAKSGRELTVEGVVVDWSGEVLTDAVSTVDLEVVRMVSEYGWYYNPSTSSESYRWYRRPVREQTLSVPVSKGRFVAKITPRQDGEAVVVRAVAQGARADLEISGSSSRYYWSGNSDSGSTPGPGAPGVVTFDAPAVAEVGAPIKVAFESPYKGRALVTLETHRVLEHRWMDVDAGTNSFEFTAKEFTPNVYASAMVFKDPHLESQESFLPARATGAASVRLAPQTFTHEVTITAPTEVRSESRLDVSIQVAGDVKGSFATVAIIDEGVLGLTNFKTPDPNADIFGRRALGVDAFDTFGWAFRREAAVGGDEDYDDGSDEAGLGRRQTIKPVAIWTGPVEVPASGKLDLGFDLPLYRGKLRVMAVVVGPQRIGSADANVVVSDPINLQATLPRFMSGGDTTQVPIFVTNSSGSERTIEVSFEAFEDLEEGASVPPQAGEIVRVLGDTRRSVTLADGDSERVVFTVEALRQSGAARFAVAAVSGDLSSRAEALVPFIPSGPRERVLKTIELEPGRVDLAAQLEGWVPTSETTTFWLTTNPYGQAFDHLTYLIRYPYGCIEQTTSATRPLLFIGDLVAQIMPELAASGEVEKMIAHGVRRVLSMQTSSGGFAYWPGSDTPDVWGTAYASHMLLDALEAGHEVPRERVDAALDWLADNVGDSDYQYAEAYVHYVLALSGRGKKARVRALQAALPRNPVGRAGEDAYLLMAALHKMGDHRFEAQLKSPDLSQPKRNARYGYSYYSDLRRRGLALSVFQELFGKDPAGEKIARQVGQLLSRQRASYYTTQELVWGITGLGKWVDVGASSYDASLSVGAAGVLKAKTSKKGSAKTWRLHRASEYPELALDVKTKSAGKLFLVISSEGVRESPSIAVGGDGLSITRVYYDVNGERLDGSEVSLGDLVFAEVILENTSGSTVENLAMVERFPAGWEVENSSLGRGALPAGLEDEDTWDLDHMNVRDDRVEAFGTLRAGEKGRIFVALRATSAGTFMTPSATAEGMYEPDMWARSADRKIRVVGPWERQAANDEPGQ